jgi:hypothetical protein
MTLVGWGVCIVLVRFRVLPNWLGRHAIVAVDPPGKVLKLTALAAERFPGRLSRLATTKGAHALQI